MIPQRRKDGSIVVPADAPTRDGALPLLGGGPVRVVLPGDADFAEWDAFAVDSDSDWKALIEESGPLRRIDTLGMRVFRSSLGADPAESVARPA